MRSPKGLNIYRVHLEKGDTEINTTYVSSSAGEIQAFIHYHMPNETVVSISLIGRASLCEIEETNA